MTMVMILYMTMVPGCMPPAGIGTRRRKRRRSVDATSFVMLREQKKLPQKKNLMGPNFDYF
jgi:hypothetical protein